MTQPPFPNPERVLVTEFDTSFPWESGGVTPADLEDHLPFVTVRRIGGNSDRVNDYPMLQIDVYSKTYAEATDVAEEVRRRLLDGPVFGPHGQIDRTVCTSAHIELPAENEAMRRISTQYRATCRRLPA